MLLTLKSFLVLLDIVLEFLKILAFLVLVSYKPVSYKKRVSVIFELLTSCQYSNLITTYTEVKVKVK